MRKDVTEFLKLYEIKSLDDLSQVIAKHNEKLNPEIIYICAEILNPNKKSTAAYYTDKMICEEIIINLPDYPEKKHITILEPSVGAGAFLPFIAEKYKCKQILEIYLIDIDEKELKLAELIFETFYRHKYKNVAIKYINKDYLLYEIKNRKFDLVIGNPPYFKLKSNDYNYKTYKKNSKLNKTSNMFALFLEKSINDGDVVSMVIPKSILNAPEYLELRNTIKKMNICSILDFGEKGFKGVKIETINIIINTNKKPAKTFVKSMPLDLQMTQSQPYITSNEFPTWLLYRNLEFDNFAKTISLGMFKSFRDRQLTTRKCLPYGKIRVLRSRNIETNKIKDISGYDLFVDNIDNIVVGKYLNKSNIVLIPNLSYSPRACFLPENCVADGSVALLTCTQKLSEDDLKIFNSDEFKEYYKIARNYGTRSLNIDSNSTFYFGVKKGESNE